MKKFGWIVVGVVVAAALAAVVYGPRTVRTIALHRAEGRWREAAVENYTWRLDTGCFGACTNGAPIEIVIHDGSLVDVSSRRHSSIEGNPVTIEQLFRRVEQEVGADSYSVTFDPALGYPAEGRFDPSRNAFDDEWGFTVERLHVD